MGGGMRGGRMGEEGSLDSGQEREDRVFDRALD